MIRKNNEQTIILSRGLTDIIKFFAAIMVAFGHYASHAINFSTSPAYRVTVMFAGNVGVALFFFLSGYGLMMSERKSHLALWPFIKRRISKVYLPVILVSFVWQLILWPSGAGWERLPHLLYATFWGFSDGILWFVKAILICYALFRIYLAFNKVNRGEGTSHTPADWHSRGLCGSIYTFRRLGGNQHPAFFVRNTCCRLQ